MTNRKINEEVLNNLYKNAHIGLQSISDLIPEVEDQKMKKELSHQYEGYERLVGEISSYMKDCDYTPKEIGPMKKMMLMASVKMNAAKEDNRSHIAEMMIKGTIMGSSEIHRDLNEYQSQLTEETVALCNKLLDLEEEYEKRLKEYL